jgi:hypothetical protein
MTQLAHANANDCSKVFGFDQTLTLSERDNFAGSYTFLEEAVRCSSASR